MKMKLSLLVGGLLWISMATAQDKAPDNWFNLDVATDKVQGVSTEKMYQELLKGKTAKQTVVVAVIDSGVEADHEDLKDVMWVNQDEIPGNGIDDDNNGYVDDVHGWNFIGGADGKNVNADNLEITRLVRYYSKKFDGVNPEDLSKKEKKEYDRYKKMEEDVTKQRENGKKNYERYAGILESLDMLQEKIGKEDITAEDLEGFESDDERLGQAAAIAQNALSKGETFEGLKDNLKGGVKYFESKFKHHYNPDFDPRGIVGDDYFNVEEKVYGNNDVEGPDAGHGTHVAGIIAAARGNDVGMDGVANNVRIMSVRAVPDGDERDKDVANAIRYAVDNGASIINMSFGKGYSWDKGVVDEAVKYAAKNDVLLVHAAGNDAENNDNTANFPNDNYEKSGWFRPKRAKNWVEVGALSWKRGEDAPATFSNFGKENVDVFAPGVDIYSTVPDQDYASYSGTSMASPVTAGVAAVLRSYFPELTAEQVKEVIMESVVPLSRKVKKPGTDELVPFEELSVTGGVVNVYKAVQKAAETKGKNKKWKSSAQYKAAGVMPSMPDDEVIKP